MPSWGPLHKVRQWCGLQKEAAFRALLPTLRLPLLVFTCYAVEQAWLERVVRAAGLRYGEISARPGLPSPLRAEPAHRLEMRADIDVCGIGINAGCEGLDLYRAATSVWISSDYSSGNLEQARARTHRIGQTQPVEYHYLVLIGAYDSAIWSSVMNRMHIREEFLANRLSLEELLQGQTSAV